MTNISIEKKTLATATLISGVAGFNSANRCKPSVCRNTKSQTLNMKRPKTLLLVWLLTLLTPAAAWAQPALAASSNRYVTSTRSGTGTRSVTIGSFAFSQYENTDGAATVWLAGSPWRVLSYEQNGNTVLAESGRAALLYDGIRRETDFSEGSNSFVPGVNIFMIRDNCDCYDGSYLLVALLDWFDDEFADTEKSAIIARTLLGGGGSYYTGGFQQIQNGVYDPNRILDIMDMENQFLWPLSCAEAQAMDAGIRAYHDGN